VLQAIIPNNLEVKVESYPAVATESKRMNRSMKGEI